MAKLSIKNVHPVAKRLFKTGKYATYAAAVAAAFKGAKASKKTHNHKPAVSGKRAHVKRVRPSSKTKTVSLGTIAGHQSAINKLVRKKLGDLAVKKMFATSKREKTRLQKEITATRRQLK